MASYEQNKNSKLWSVRFREIDLDTAEERNMRLSGFKTKREAQAAYHDHLTAYEAEKELRRASRSKRPEEEMTFGQLTELYFESLRTGTRGSSLVTYKSKYDSNIKPYFDDRIVSDIKPIDIINWQNAMIEKGYKFNYLKGLRQFFNSVWIFAEVTFDIKNIARKVKGFRDTNPITKKLKVWTQEQVRTFLSAVDEKYRLFFKTLYVTGCRRGEIFALSWDDIDEINCTISITKSLARKPRPWAVTPPKNSSSIRTVFVDHGLIDELKAHAKKEGFNKRFLFGGDKPYAERTAERVMQQAIERADLPSLTMHGLRHSCASVLISRGVSIVAVSHRLGHNNVEETLNTYAHLMPDDVGKMTAIMAEI